MRLLWSFLSAAAVSAFTTTNIIDPDFSIGEQRPYVPCANPLRSLLT